MSEKYTNPPVSTIGIALRFPFESWKTVIQQYIDKKQNRFTEVIFFPKDYDNPFKIQEGALEEQLEKIKVVSLIKDNCYISIGDDGILITEKRRESYPKFSKLLEFIQENLPFIINRSYSQIGLFYVDDIYLPVENTWEDIDQFINGNIIKNSLFNIPVKATNNLFRLSPLEEKDEYTFRVFVSNRIGENGIRIQYDWRYSIVSDDEKPFDDYITKLHEVREMICKCFEQTITDKCRNIFRNPFNNYRKAK